ncbi:MAG: hypothetical protein NC131_15735, partial [Roseburia sp.]|nr:hypothetical protein [Roseburia sp.]
RYMKKDNRKQVKAYSLGGIILLAVVIAVVIALIVCGVITVPELKNCSGTNAVKILREEPEPPAPVYSDVLKDLGKDKDFDVTAYPKQELDYSLKLIQLAESVSGELFVYVYNPSADRVASEIRFSTGINDNKAYKDYALKQLSAAETLSKYIVEDFAVLPDALRYYDVSQLARAWDTAIDPMPDDDNTVSYGRRVR